jgi:hypothetical protein
MVSYLYGLILSRNAERVPAHLRGIDDAPLRVVVCDALAAIVSTMDAAPSRENRGAVVGHDVGLGHVVRQGITAVPSRFGQTFADDASLCAELSATPNRDALIATLERHDGRGEMRIMMRGVIDPPAAARGSIEPSASPGRAYLESVRETLKPRPPVDFRGLVGGLVLDERVERRGDVQTISHLVRFEDETRYRSELYSQAALEGATIMGPHALYSFAEPG